MYIVAFILLLLMILFYAVTLTKIVCLVDFKQDEVDGAQVINFTHKYPEQMGLPSQLC